MGNIFINKKIWSTFTEEEHNNYVQEVFEHYRKNGFPYFELTPTEIEEEYLKMRTFDTERILEGDTIKQFMLGLNLVNSYMPHMWSTKCKSFSTPIEAFNDDGMLKMAIIRRMKMGDNISDAAIRKAIGWVKGTHRVSNFRPTAAKWVYDTFSGDGNVIDFSCGYGGRLLGALSSEKVKTYTGTDPCKTTYDALIKMKKTLSTEKDIVLYNKPFEDLELYENFYDLSFSSPPYFNTEEYSYEDTQSFIRYKTKEEWKFGFLENIIKKNFVFLKKGGKFVINIANVKTYKELEKDTIELCLDAGFKLVCTYKLMLSSMMSEGFKYEPMFLFEK